MWAGKPSSADIFRTRLAVRRPVSYSVFDTQDSKQCIQYSIQPGTLNEATFPRSRELLRRDHPELCRPPAACVPFLDAADTFCLTTSYPAAVAAATLAGKLARLHRPAPEFARPALPHRRAAWACHPLRPARTRASVASRFADARTISQRQTSHTVSRVHHRGIGAVSPVEERASIRKAPLCMQSTPQRLSAGVSPLRLRMARPKNRLAAFGQVSEVHRGQFIPSGASQNAHGRISQVPASIALATGLHEGIRRIGENGAAR
mmetsp:Transcript_19649/g.61808  ORF Transcript_19649/g.61808 Transcript_19649/m.61808 type:complete len:262 (+) Transcript_19649:1132-1917(+)